MVEWMNWMENENIQTNKSYRSFGGGFFSFHSCLMFVCLFVFNQSKHSSYTGHKELMKKKFVWISFNPPYAYCQSDILSKQQQQQQQQKEDNTKGNENEKKRNSRIKNQRKTFFRIIFFCIFAVVVWKLNI